MPRLPSRECKKRLHYVLSVEKENQVKKRYMYLAVHYYILYVVAVLERLCCGEL